MKFLADVNIEKQIVDGLRNENYDIKWISEINPKISDVEILQIAKEEDRILLTNDKGHF